MANEIYSSSWWGEGVCTNTIDWGSSYKALANCTPSFSNRFSLNFDGVDDYVTSSNPLTYGNPYTISIWAKLNETPAFLNLFNINDGVNSIALCYWAPNNSGHPIYGKDILFKSGDGQTYSLSIDTDITLWHSYIFTFDGVSTTEIYVDGVSNIATSAASLGTVATNTMEISRGWSGGYQSSMNADELSVWDSELSVSDIATIYNSGTPADLSSLNPTAWYRNGDNGTWARPQWLIPSNENKDNVSNYSFAFDGVDDYVDVGSLSYLQNATEYSISSWFKSPLNNLYQVIYSWFDGADGYLQLLLVNDGSLVVYNYRTSNAYGVSATGVVSADIWYNATVVFEGSGATNADRLKLYINDTLITLTYTGTIPTQTGTMLSSTMWLGANSGFNFWGLEGNIDEVSAFNSALSSEDVTTIYNGGTPTTLPSGAVSHWKMGENSTFVGGVWAVEDVVGSNDGTSSGMLIDARVGDAPNSTLNAVSLNMDEVDRETDVPA